MIRRRAKGLFRIATGFFLAFFTICRFRWNFLDAIEIDEHQITRVNYRVALGVHTIHIENGVIVHDIDATNLVQKMKAAVAVFRDIANRLVQWNCSTQINNGVMVNGDAMMVLALIPASKVKMITMEVTRVADTEKIGKYSIRIVYKIAIFQLRFENASKNLFIILRSPSDSRSRIWSSELAKHLQFDLVDTAGMTEDQLREIPYTVVETQAKQRNSNNNNSVKVHKNHAKDRVDRIRG